MFRTLTTTGPQNEEYSAAFKCSGAGDINVEAYKNQEPPPTDAGSSAPTYQTNIPNSGEDYQCDQSNEK